MRKLLAFLLIIIGLVVGGLFCWHQTLEPLSSEKIIKRFVITKGASASQIGNKLKEEGLIKSSLVFKIYVQVSGNSDKIQAGEYRLPTNLSLPELVATLLRGPLEVWVTIPEGLRREEIVERFIQALSLVGEEAKMFQDKFLLISNNKEGFLFPDTYLFPKSASASAVVKKMLNTFDKRVDSQIERDLRNKDMGLNEMVILASIVERETGTETEKPIIAGILLKRLEENWPLQADAAVQYAVASAKCRMSNAKCDWWQLLDKDDLAISSGYNTYKFKGLPPSPIANPGLSSIKAVVYSQDSPYWFYLHDSQGGIHYARTIEEHDQNIRTYLGK